MLYRNFIIIGLISAVILVILLRKRKTENFCGTCSPLGRERPMDRNRKTVLYQEGLLTENSPEVYRPWNERG